MSDIVERLRQQATVEAKKFGDSADIQLEWKAAAEIERLRADRRERIATAALTGLLACPEITGTHKELTNLAVDLADALIARLDKEAKP